MYIRVSGSGTSHTTAKCHSAQVLTLGLTQGEARYYAQIATADDLSKYISSSVSMRCSLIYGGFRAWVLPSAWKRSGPEGKIQVIMFTKRVILAGGARLLREMLHHAIDQSEHLEVIRDMPDGQALPEEIVRSDPQWVIIPTAFRIQSHSWIEDYPHIRFIFLSPGKNRIKLRCQTFKEEKTDVSLEEFILVLEKDLHHP